jgi:thiamine biosynthesis lipoprotein
MRERLAEDPLWTPTTQEIDLALSCVGASRIQLSGRDVVLGGDGMAVTLDGIAKGFVVDRLSETLREHGIENHLVNAGGDIRTSGERTPETSWTIAIQNPAKDKPYSGFIRMTTGAVATSGDYEVYYDKAKVFHHIVNPHTGLSPTHCAGVTVRAATAMEADALSTATFVLGPREGTRLIDSLDNRECLILDHSGRPTRSRGWV